MANLTGSANCIRYVLFAFNFVFVITGIILISVGASVGGAYKEYDEFLEQRFFSIPTFLIVIGSFIFVIAFFGCYGAYRENYCMTLTFSVLITIIFIFELSAGIAGYVLRNETVDLIGQKLNTAMNDYESKENNRYMLDGLQNTFNCCGVKSPDDWIKILKPKVENGTNPKYLPLSCCRIPVGAIGKFECIAKNEIPELRPQGCLDSFAEYISSHAVSLGAAGIVFAILQFAGIIFSCYVAREIKTKQGITGRIF